MDAVIICWRWQAGRTFCLVTVNSSFQTECRPSWQKGVHSCSPWAGLPPVLLQHDPPFLAIEKWILRQNILRRQRKTALCAAFGDTGKKWWEGVMLNCVHVSVYREPRERNKLIVHSVPLPVLTHPPFSPSRPLSLTRSNLSPSRFLNGFQISSCWFPAGSLDSCHEIQQWRPRFWQLTFIMLQIFTNSELLWLFSKTAGEYSQHAPAERTFQNQSRNSIYITL